MDESRIIHGNALDLPLEDASVDLIVTSPPYFALRSYRDDGAHYDGQVGSEATPQEFLEALWAATAEMVRTLKPTGSIWVNLGDKYAGSGGHNNNGLGKSGLVNSKKYLDGRSDQGSIPATRRNAPDRYNQSTEIGRRIDKYGQRYVTGGIPAKSLMGLPWRYALGCIDQLGLILRAEVVWSKPNGLPESVTDRVRRSHETWFHFTKQGRYFSAVDEVREPHLSPEQTRTPGRALSTHVSPIDGGPTGIHSGAANPLGKIPGSVWTIPSEPLIIPDAVAEHYKLPDHFAAFPTEWPRRIILGWSPSGICTACGEGRRPVVEPTPEYAVQRVGRGDWTKQGNGVDRAITGNRDGGTDFRPEASHLITGYACACTPYTDHPERRGKSFHAPGRDAAAGNRANAAERSVAYRNGEAGPTGPVREYHVDRWTPPPTTPAIVLDPFCGTGTTVLVARALGRTGIGVELSKDYCRLAEWRVFASGAGAKAERCTWAERQLGLL